MGIIDYLPAINKEFYTMYQKVITPGQIEIPAYTKNYSLLQYPIENQRGLFLSFGLEVNSPDLLFQLKVDETTYSGTIAGLYNAGFTQLEEGLPTVIQYNSTSSIYTVVVSWARGFPFNENVYVTCDNITSSPIAVNELAVQAIILKNGFYKELHKAINGELP